MFSELENAATARVKHLGNEQPEFAIAEHCHFAADRERRLIENLASSRQRFHEDRRFERNAVRHHVEIALWQCKKFAEGTRMPHDPQNRPLRAVATQPARAPGTFAAGEVYFPHYTLAYQ